MHWAKWEASGDCTAGPEPGARALLAWLLESYPEGSSMGIFNCRPVRGSSAPSVHGEGRAVDFGLPMINGRGCPTGHAIVDRLGPHGVTLGLQTVIYDRKIWSGRSPNGRDYQGQAPHFDHVHLELTRKAGKVMTLATFRSVLGGSGGGFTAAAGAPPGALQRGSRGDEVCRLQERLRALGFSIDVVAGCPFGPQTEKAVIAFQTQNGLTPDGKVGKNTRAALQLG